MYRGVIYSRRDQGVHVVQYVFVLLPVAHGCLTLVVDKHLTNILSIAPRNSALIVY